ncbi:MAG: gluconate 2-dehydrogenase subunit 3 family protein [Bryobacteraceae bacterium]
MSDAFVKLDANPAATRRQAIRAIAASLMSVGLLDLDAAQQVHHEAAASKASGPYQPKAFGEHEYKTLRRLAELIVPADEVSGSAVDAGAPEFIDVLSAENTKLADIFHGGIAWLDAEMLRRHAKTFVDCAAAHQTAMLDRLVAAEREERDRRGEELVYRRSDDYRGFSGYTVERQNPLAAGAKFFDWVRKMSVDAFYTSPIGVKDIGYVGNRAWSKYEAPKEAIDYAMRRSPFPSA